MNKYKKLSEALDKAKVPTDDRYVALFQPYKVGIILPSRGLVFSQTADEILQNVQGIDHKFFFAHKLPIPNCFENPTLEALKDESITHLWFVEDDMILPPDILKKLLDMDIAVATVDYPVTKEGKGALFKVKNENIFCGTGCMLVKREVFNELRKPYFTSSIRWNIKNYGDFIKFKAVESNDGGYGLHDVNFCMNLYRLNIPIHDVGIVLGQRKLISLGKAGSNDGAHNIEKWTKVKKNYRLKQIKSWGVEQSGNLVSVIIDNKELLVTKAHARKLIKLGAEKPAKRAVVVDWGLS